MLLDCGEGTYGQMVRFFGPEKVDEILANLNAVYISHLHADHHIGLVGVLQGRQKAIEQQKLYRDPLLLFAPKQILAWLSFYDRFFEEITTEFQLIPNADLVIASSKNVFCSHLFRTFLVTKKPITIRHNETTHLHHAINAKHSNNLR